MSAWATIPGETPLPDRSGLKIPTIQTRQQLDDYEFVEIQKVAAKYLSARPMKRTAPFDFTWIEQLHGEMFGAIWEWPGRFRTEQVNIGLPWHQCQPSVQELLDNLALWKADGVDLLVQATRLHYHAVRIHPFLNGNGRWARMLANIWLMQNRHPIVVWPDRTIGKESVERSEYLKSLKAADEGDFDPLLALHRRFVPSFAIQQGWAEVTSAAEGFLGVQGISFRALASRLLKAAAIDKQHHEVLSQLRNLERRATRHPDTVTADDAQQFADLADRMRTCLAGAADSPPSAKTSP